MRILHLDQHPCHQLPYQRVKSRNQGQGIETTHWPFYEGLVDRLPQGVQAIVAMSDLQGAKDGKLVGHEIITVLGELLQGVGIAQKKTGIILAGDLHSDPTLQKRGGAGDVRELWTAMANTFRWVVGVAGNHDTFGNKRELAEFRSTKGVHLMDGSSVVLDGTALGGVCGVIGNPKRPWRKLEAVQCETIRKAINSSPALLVLHEGPDLPSLSLDGSPQIRAVLEECRKTSVICGHRHWEGNALQTLSNGTEVLNVEGKAVILRVKRYRDHLPLGRLTHS